MGALQLTQIVKSFGDTRVLGSVDLEVQDGEFLTLVGPSGCGKSTLLRIIAGLEAPDGGRVTLDGRDVTGLRAADRNLAMVFQSYALYPHLTVAENMVTPLRLRDLSAVERIPVAGPLISRAKRRALMEKVREVAEVLRIEPLLGRKPGQLSGGQRQRVALGRAMVREPVAFLMDEPLSNLDAALRVHMRAELSELHRRLATTFIYVTHDQSEALTMSDRIAVMMGGDILQLASPQEVYDNPSSLAVAVFIGSPRINTLPGEVDGDGVVRVGGRALARRVTGAPGPVTVGLRPEHLELRVAPGEDALSGRLVHTENLGSDIFLHLAVEDGAHRLIARAQPGTATALSIGDTVHVVRASGEAMVFDAAGRRLPMAGERRAVEVA
ncbi:ABC transporter ATP-binding protein [Pontivivens ytuae]|uniref:ABC transporter ATP-binding protein n=1 Tax=Pontivivens ytuae TaxID=2789856 RepID=A0A7S9LRZ8_9RHOB|nr:ABC transporter ATP-binding protein [Pontivivens ytuae]QPH53655.1 ABC transporter ATP-binding protein [Pontivivens ytuae]